MKILIDTNILLDVLLKREPFYEKSAILWTLVNNKEIIGYISAVTVTNIFYIVKKSIGYEKAIELVKIILKTFKTAEVNTEILNEAILINIKDYEDAVQYVCALKNNCDYIVTRNIKDFPDENKILIVSTEEILQKI